MQLTGCTESEQEAFTKLDEAQSYVTVSFDKKEENLAISDDLNDALGINMSIILDGILKKGYQPNGLEQKEGYRIYK